jgi:hypothetical protein
MSRATRRNIADLRSRGETPQPVPCYGGGSQGQGAALHVDLRHVREVAVHAGKRGDRGWTLPIAWPSAARTVGEVSKAEGEVSPVTGMLQAGEHPI